MQRFRQLFIINFPLRLLLLSYCLLLLLTEKVQNTTQKESNKHDNHNNKDILVYGTPFLLNSFNRNIPYQVKRSVINTPHINQRVFIPNIMIKHDIFSVTDGLGNLCLKFLIHNIVGTIKVRQIQMSGIPLSHPCGL